MTTIASRVYLDATDDLPACRLAGTEHDIPIIRFESGMNDAEIVLHGGTLAEQADYLEGFGRTLIALACDARQAVLDRTPIEPEGYDAPVVTHVGGCNELCDGDSHYLVADQPVPYVLDERKAAEMHQ